MKKGNFAAMIVAAVLFATCAKPKLNGVADGVILTMNDVSADMSKSINGGFSQEEIKNCENKSFSQPNLKLPTGSRVNLEIKPESFSLFTSKTSFMDTQAATWYQIDRLKNSLTIHTQNWKWEWIYKQTLDLNLSNDPKTEVDLENPFQVARRRLGVRLGIRPDIFNPTDSSLLLSEEENEAVLCASALNTYYELIFKKNYTFKE